MHRVTYFFILLFFIQLDLTCYAQSKLISITGQVIDPASVEPLSFVNIRFLGTTVGIRANEKGEFKFDLNTWPSDSLQFSLVGYEKVSVGFDTSINQHKIKVELYRSNTSLKKLVIKYDPNQALKLIKKVIENRDANNQDKAENYKYEVYNKMELDITRLPKGTFKGKGPLKAFGFMKDFIDSTNEEKPFLPMFLTETLSDYYFQTKPKKSKEIIKATKISGYKNASVSKFLGSMYQNINIYNNYIPIFDISFVSPIGATAPLFYKYTIVDTIQINYHDYYKVLFEPKRPGDHTFRGDILIHERDYAVKRVSMQVTGEQQINWVEKIDLVQEFDLIDEYDWFLVKDKFFVDFNAYDVTKVAGFIHRKTTTYKNIVINNPAVENIINDKTDKNDLVITDGADERDATYWDTNRHGELSDNEKSIYRMIDTIQSLPIYNKYYNFLYFLSTGIKEFGALELGPIYNIYSYNIIEGNRIRLNLGTTPRLFKNAYINGYVAYGTLDQRMKYYGNVLWLFDRTPRKFINFTYMNDLDNTLGVYDTDVGSFDNIFSTIGRKANIPWKLVFVNKKRLEFFNEFHNGFSQLLSLEHKKTTPYAPLPIGEIFTSADGLPTNGATTFEIGLQLRFAYLEKYVEGNYWRTSLGTKYPAVKLYTGLGINNFLNSNESYFKVRLSVADNQPLGSAGKLYYHLFAGKVFGTLPYTLLEIHPGNEFYYYNKRMFSMMNRFEYISDTYIGLMVEHTMGSFIFKYIPGLQKTKIRTFWNAKGVYGGLTQANKERNFQDSFPFQTLTASPYLELGTGVENIFKLLRLDFVWRVAPSNIINDHPTKKFGVFCSVKFEF